MKKFEALKVRAEYAQKEQLEMYIQAVDVLELLAIQAQLVEALKNARVYVSHEGDDEELGELNAALSAAGAQP
jgi:hypothetical protein